MTQGPLNAQHKCTLDGTQNPGGVQVISMLSFLTQPGAQTVLPGATAIFNVTANNVSGGLAYQWRRDGVNIDGQIRNRLTLTNAAETDEAIYDVVISAAASAGEITLRDVTLTQSDTQSQPASLIVGTSPLRMLRQPVGAMIPLGGSVVLSAAAVGPATPALTYQWMLNGKAVAKATAMNYALTNATLAQAGAYTCVVKSGTTSITSNNAEVAVVDNKPKTVNLLVGGTFAPTVSAAGNTLTYAWKRDDVTLASTAKTFSIKPLAVADAGIYTCTVTGPSGSIDNGFNTTLNITGNAPTLGTISLPDAFIGQSYYYKLPVLPIAGAPAASFSVTGALPAGISFNSATGVLSGRPTVSKEMGYSLKFKAINAKGSSLEAAATLTVVTLDPYAIGTFAGPAPRSSLNDNLGGRFDLTTTTAGTFSGSVTLGARAKISFTNLLLQVSGANDQVLYGNITGIAMATATDKAPLAALVEVFVADQTACLTLTHPNGTKLVIPAWKAANPATAYATVYSARLNGGQGDEVSPDGYGFATFTVAPAGTLTLAGKLPDGTAYTTGSYVGQQGQVLVNQLLYANKGSLVGQFNLAAKTPVSSTTLTGALTWNKPPITTETIYRLGFGPLNVTVEGGAYVAPLAGNRVMNLPAVTAPNTNAILAFSLGGLSESFNQTVRITNPSPTGLTNTSTLGTPVLNTTTMPVISAATGAFNGQFIIPGTTVALNRPAPFFGQIVKIGSTTQGYGYFLLPKVPVGTEKVTTSPKLSGVVELKTP